MIVTSRRCFINILAQFMDLKTLINANYYIADVTSPNNFANIGDQFRYNEDGQLVNESMLQPSGTVNVSPYHIRYGQRELDPTPFITNVMIGIGSDDTNGDPYKRYAAYLNSTDTMISVYRFLFQNKPKGNGLQFLIFYDNMIVEDWGGFICEYLSKNFGEDITFVDAEYRKPYVKGVPFYKGDKEYAKKTIMDLRDAALLIDFNSVICQSNYDGSCESNLVVWLNQFNGNQLMHLYELIFPDDPLPSGNYATDHIKRIIIGRVTDGMPKNPFPFQNLYVSDEYLQSLQEELDAEDAPF